MPGTDAGAEYCDCKQTKAKDNKMRFCKYTDRQRSTVPGNWGYENRIQRALKVSRREGQVGKAAAGATEGSGNTTGDCGEECSGPRVAGSDRVRSSTHK